VPALALLVARPAAADGGRAALVVPEPRFDFGTVERGAKIEHTFVLGNRGDATLRIENVKGSCGCTVGVASARDVPPGREGAVLVILDTAGMAGRTTKVVTVYTSDPQAPATSLAMTGEVLADVVATPPALYLGKLRRGEATTREVLIGPGRPDGVATVTAVEHSNPSLRATLGPRPEGAGQRVVVALDRDTPLGRFNDTLRLSTTSSREPVVTVPVFGSVEGDVVVLPPQVTFGVARPGSVVERELFIRNRGDRPVTVTRVAVPERLASYSLAALEAGQQYRLTLRLREDLRPGKFEDTIEIFTDHPDEERIVVPFYAIVRGGRRRG
jgi:hypothetical protein